MNTISHVPNALSEYGGDKHQHMPGLRLSINAALPFNDKPLNKSFIFSCVFQNGSGKTTRQKRKIF